jgi:type II secretory pathway predicted ATPase ExeA
MTGREGQGTDPFGETTDPGVYVARTASEAALEALWSALEERRLPALVGPPGIGKTLLLHRLAARAETTARRVAIHLPYAAIEADELCRWVLGQLGVTESRSPREVLLCRAKTLAAEGRGLLVAVDEASGLTRETAECLAGLSWQAGGALGIVMAATDDARASRALAALGIDLEPVRYTRPLDLAETAAYVSGRLAQRGAPLALRTRFDDEAVGWIYRLSGGIPRRIHEVASMLIEAPPESVSPAWWKECGAVVEKTARELDPEGADACRPWLPDDLGDEGDLELWVGEGEEIDDLDRTELDLD